MSAQKRPKPAEQTAPAPTIAPEQSIVPAQVKAPPSETYTYYRIKKIDGHSYQILEVQVDESLNPPKQSGKTDLARNVLDRMGDIAYQGAKAVFKKK